MIREDRFLISRSSPACTDAIRDALASDGRFARYIANIARLRVGIAALDTARRSGWQRIAELDCPVQLIKSAF